MFRRSLFAAIPLASLLLAGCASGGGGDFNLISIEEEWQLGAQLSRDIEQQMPIVRDPAALAYVNRVGRGVVAQTNMANLPFEFHIVADPSVNAFAIPGGHVYVHTGLIKAADNASELAGVIAHEVSHITARHATEQLTRQYGLSILASLVLGQNPAAYQQILAQVLAAGALARYSRGAEEEADDLGVQAMYRAGYDPKGMATMFEELLQRKQGQPGAVERFFSSHPLTEDRIRNTRRRIDSLPPRSDLKTDEPEFRSLRSRL